MHGRPGKKAVPGAVHIDLYDDVDVIPWDVIEEFLGRHLA